MIRVFYGWWIVTACSIIALFVSGSCQYGFTAFFEPIHNEFGWTYTQISIAASFKGMETGLLSPIMGILVDRWGPRRLMFAATLFLGVGLILFSRVDSLGMFYGSFAFMVISISVLIGTVPMAALANWFRKKISLAIGIVSCGTGFGGLIVILIVESISLFGWRTTAMILGLATLGIATPLSLVVRHKPEKYGYLVDGEIWNTANHINNTSVSQPVEINITAKQALRTSTFWHITLAMACHLAIMSSIMTHVMPYLSSVGIPVAISGLVASAIPLISIIGRLGSGWLGDRLNKRWITSANFGAMSLGLLFFSFVSAEKTWLLIPFLLFLGIGYGGNFTVNIALMRDVFGRSQFGTINGVMFGIITLGSILGPIAAGYAFDTTGSYQIIWPIFSFLALIALFSMVTTPARN